MAQNEIRGKDLIKLAISLGWLPISQTGSHRKFRHPDHPYPVMIPIGHSKNTGKGLTAKILKELYGEKVLMN